jgi:parvulin-like peptidyl-prolyl isomerase
MARRNRDHQADDRFWAALRHEIEIEQLVQQLREQERAQISPTDAKLRAYYRAHPDKFTEPERVRVSVILLRVHPSSPQSAWDAAQREGGQLVARLREGADFGELARLHSADTTTAAKGGDVGYVHKGMLSSVVDEALATMQPGDITPPLTVLEGVAIFKLDAREPARLGDYQHVKTRVLELWQVAEEERSWKALMSKLRSETTVVIEEKHLTPG